MVRGSNALSEYARWVLEPQLPARPAKPRVSCLICAAPRSGSWLLSGLLHSTGVAGRPHEYFYSETEAANRRNWGISTATDYLDRVLEVGTTSNGVFACKLTWACCPTSSASSLSRRQRLRRRPIVDRGIPAAAALRLRLAGGRRGASDFMGQGGADRLLPPLGLSQSNRASTSSRSMGSHAR